jgi:phospholipid/cholesterol/gamma-HCH transport system substrate-binding protein
MEQHADSRLAPLEKKIYVFFAGAVLLAIMFFLATSYKQDFFTRMTTLYFFSDNATGIKPGMAVKTLGFNIGEVEDISIEPNAKVRVKMSVQSDYMRFITLDSHAKLFKEGLIGESVIEISPGNQQLRQLAHNAVLPFDRGRDLTEIADELYGEIKPILQDLGKTMAAVNNPEGDIQQSLRNVNQATKNVQSLTGNLASGLPPLLGKADNIAKTVNDNLPPLIENSKQSLGNIRDATSDLKQITSASAQEIPQALHDGRALVKGSLSIVNGVKETWPVRNMISPPQEQPLVPDSYVPPRSAR